ncbi:hypothetical protein WAX88_01305 [Photobacterium damselae subsp. damselae]|uniref:hypothetical protein n=1 Tax=Photobacterium damselae TaxID=38293 RepID=UPI00311AE666
MGIEYLLSELDKQTKFKGNLKDDALLYLLQDGVDYALDILKLAKAINAKISIETEGLAKGGINDDSGTGTINVPKATKEQVIDGKSDDVAVTPASLAAKLEVVVKNATEDEAGITETATQEETDAGLDRFRYITPKTLTNSQQLKDIIKLINDLDLSGTGIKTIKGNNTSTPHSGDNVELDLDSDFGGAKKNGDKNNNFNVKDATADQHAVSFKQLKDAATGVSYTAFGTPIVIHPKAQLPSNIVVDLNVSGHGIPDGALVFVNFTAYPDIAGTARPNEKIYGLINHGDSNTIATSDNANFECAGEDNGSRTFGASGQVSVVVKNQKINVSRTKADGKDLCYFSAAISGWLGS